VLGGIRGETMRRTDRGLAPFQAGDVFTSVRLLVDGVEVATDTALSGHTVDLELGSEYMISRGSAKTVSMVCDLRPDAGDGNYLVAFHDSTFISLWDHDLEIPVSPVLAGAGYPILTADVSVTAAGLSGSFVNWPNPFSPAKQVTHFGFNLPEAAVIDLEIFTITGDLVRTLAEGAHLAVGPHDDDFTWDGKNGAGQMVVPGTYLCRIRAEYESGATGETLRRLAVIR
jgi:hypothetical protein